MTVPIEILNKFPKLSNEKILLNLSNPFGKNNLYSIPILQTKLMINLLWRGLCYLEIKLIYWE